MAQIAHAPRIRFRLLLAVHRIFTTTSGQIRKTRGLPPLTAALTAATTALTAAATAALIALPPPPP